MSGGSWGAAWATGPAGELSGLPAADPALEEALLGGLARVEEKLRDAVRSTDHFADATARHLVLAGGKRVRPMLTLLTSHLGSANRPEVLDAAVVVELIHLGSLYHDDVMDLATVRRGAPAAHQVWGNSVAILTGDLLFARASGLVANLGPEAVRIQAATFERLCLGQLHETVGPAEGVDPVDHYIQVLADKTGSLIATSARFGAMFAGCPSDVVELVVAFGEKVGVAFQLSDDVIDLAGRDTGKTVGTDLRAGVPTLPVLLLRQAAQSGDGAAAALVELLDTADLDDPAVLDEAVTRLRSHEATAQAAAEARRWARQARDHLDPLPRSTASQALAAFADAVAARTR